MKYDSEFIKELKIRIGLLPYLSESLPNIGENKNWKREKIAITTPTRNAPPPVFSIRRGRMGIKIPNPKRSIKATRRIVKSFLSIDSLTLPPVSHFGNN